MDVMSFKKLLSKERQNEIAANNKWYAERMEEFEQMTDENLADTTEFFLTQMRTPWKHQPGTPVYDSTFYHILIPEILKRLKGR
jgi:hypothetical protein